MLRLFIALPLPSEVEQRLGQLISLFQPGSNNVKWVASKNIHSTIKFLGDTKPDLVPSISAVISRIAGGFHPFDITLDRVGAFPNLKRPRVIWVGSSVKIETAPLIAGEIDRAMREFGFEKEKRPFKAHLTLGRVRQGRSIDELARYIGQYQLEPIELKLDRLTLFKSTLTPGGAIYERLHEAMLEEEKIEG